MAEGLVYIGKILATHPIDGADRIQRAEVVCGKGGRWSGVVQKEQFHDGDPCQVYLQDTLLPHLPEFAFMEPRGWRIRQMKFKGVPSECLIMPQTIPGGIGEDVTLLANVEKYSKPVDAVMAGDIAGSFPAWIPKTDEPHFQGVSELVSALVGKPFYLTEKEDGTSSTAFHRDGRFGVCSRNNEMKDTPNSVYWKVAHKYGLPEKLPKLGNVAIQWETVGPKIQKNPMGLKDHEARVFDLYLIDDCRYGTLSELSAACVSLGMPMVAMIEQGSVFKPDALQDRAEGKYPNGHQREGIVIRPTEPFRLDGVRVSFKVLNLLYKD